MKVGFVYVAMTLLPWRWLTFKFLNFKRSNFIQLYHQYNRDIILLRIIYVFILVELITVGYFSFVRHLRYEMVSRITSCMRYIGGLRHCRKIKGVKFLQRHFWPNPIWRRVSCSSALLRAFCNNARALRSGTLCKKRAL